MATSTRSTPMPSGGGSEPLLVLVVGEDAPDRERLRAGVRFAGIPLELVDVASVEQAIRLVHGLYESPRGCPDVVVANPAATDLQALFDALGEPCPGVRVVGVDPEQPGAIDALASELARVQALVAAFA